MKRVHYFRADGSRLVKNYPMYLAFVGVALSLLFSLENYAFEEVLVNGSALDTYQFAANLSGVMIAYAFCAFPYAGAFCEDLERKYLRCSISRGNVRSYVLSKAAVVYLSSVVTMVAGTALFAFYIRFRVEWVSEQSLSVGFGMYASLQQEGHYMAYVLLCALQYGMLAGTLSLLAALVSVFISNRMLVLVVPILAYQIVLQYSGLGWLGNGMIFRPELWTFDSDVLYFLIVCGHSLVPSALFTWGIYRRIKSRL